MCDPRPIGVFDSGVGGLTVARAILDLLPHEPLIYVGDSARFPYGPKPVEEIRRYAIEIADYLVHRDVKMLVVACNSVEVSGLGDIAARAGIPVVGVIDPGTRTAVHATRNGVIGLIGTEATVDEPAPTIGPWPRPGHGCSCTPRRARSSWSTWSEATPRAIRCEPPRGSILCRWSRGASTP